MWLFIARTAWLEFGPFPVETLIPDNSATPKPEKPEREAPARQFPLQGRRFCGLVAIERAPHDDERLRYRQPQRACSRSGGPATFCQSSREVAPFTAKGPSGLPKLIKLVRPANTPPRFHLANDVSLGYKCGRSAIQNANRLRGPAAVFFALAPPSKPLR